LWMENGQAKPKQRSTTISKTLIGLITWILVL